MQTKIIAVTKQPLHNQPPNNQASRLSKILLILQNLAQCGGGEVVKTVLKGVSFARLEGQGGIREGRMIAGPSSVQTPATQFNEID